MILFTILAIMLLILGVLFVLAVSVGGSVAILLFGDVIVCAVIIVLILRKIVKKNNEDE